MLPLFQSNNLSKKKAEFSKFETSKAVLLAEINAVLGQKYQIQPQSVLLVEHNAVLNQNYLIESASGRYILRKKIGDGSIVERLKWECQISKALVQKSIPASVVIDPLGGSDLFYDGRQAWILFKFIDGDYFSGERGELESAADGFFKLTHALKEMKIDKKTIPQTDFYRAGPIRKLVEILESTQPEQLVYDEQVTPYFESEYGRLLNLARTLIKVEDELVADSWLMHMDFHPLNILMKKNKLMAILDYEDIQYYPLKAGVGFAGYKLIRQAVVKQYTDEGRLLPSDFSSFADIWVKGWNSVFNDLPTTIDDLRMGALYRLLANISFILDAWVSHQNPKFNFDFAKQIGSLQEAELIFSSTRKE